MKRETGDEGRNTNLAAMWEMMAYVNPADSVDQFRKSSNI